MTTKKIVATLDKAGPVPYSPTITTRPGRTDREAETMTMTATPAIRITLTKPWPSYADGSPCDPCEFSVDFALQGEDDVEIEARVKDLARPFPAFTATWTRLES